MVSGYYLCGWGVTQYVLRIGSYRRVKAVIIKGITNLALTLQVRDDKYSKIIIVTSFSYC